MVKQPVCDRSKRACDFVQLPNPYYGMWIASRERLQYFMTTSHWRCACADPLVLSIQQTLPHRLSEHRRATHVAVKVR